MTSATKTHSGFILLRLILMSSLPLTLLSGLSFGLPLWEVIFPRALALNFQCLVVLQSCLLMNVN